MAKSFPGLSVWPARLGDIPTISVVVKRLNEDNSCNALSRVPGAEYRAFSEYSNNNNGFPWWLAVKNLPASAGNSCLIPESGRSPGEGNGNRLQYSCLANPKDRGAWWAAVHGVEKSHTT